MDPRGLGGRKAPLAHREMQDLLAQWDSRDKLELLETKAHLEAMVHLELQVLRGHKVTPALGVHRVRKASKALVATKERQEIVEKLGTLERLAHKATLVQLDPRDPLAPLDSQELTEKMALRDLLDCKVLSARKEILAYQEQRVRRESAGLRGNPTPSLLARIVSLPST